MEAERAAFHNSQSHHKGRRLLGTGSTSLLSRRRSYTMPSTSFLSRRRSYTTPSTSFDSRRRSNTTPTASPSTSSGQDVLQEFFGGGTDCTAAKGGGVKAVALKKGGEWTYVGQFQIGHASEVNFVYLRKSSEQNPCGYETSGICMDIRRKIYCKAWARDCSKSKIEMVRRACNKCTYKTEAAAEAARKADIEKPPAHKETERDGRFGYNHLPKIIGKTGDCFAKCNHVVNAIMGTDKCKYARDLDCKTDAGRTGYIKEGIPGIQKPSWQTCY